MPSTRSSGDDVEQPIDEVERFLHLRRRLEELRAEMALQDDRPLKDYAVPSEDEPHSSIVNPAVQANNFELKPSLLQIVQQNQFSGNPTEDPTLHLSVFVQFTDTLKIN